MSLLRRALPLLLALACLAWIAAACSAAAPTPTQAPAAPAATQPPAAPAATSAPAAPPTMAPPPQPTPPPAAAATTAPTQPPLREARVIELEWPARMKLGDSDTIRLSLLPSSDGYTITTEFPEHQVSNQDLPIQRPAGYNLQAAARLEGVAFEILPAGDQLSDLPLDQSITWHWTLRPLRPGQQRLSVRLLLRWVPSLLVEGQPASTKETLVYSKGIDVQVSSFLGMTTGQAAGMGWVGLFLGGGASLYGLAHGRTRRPQAARLQVAQPDPRVQIEPRAGLRLEPGRLPYLQALFYGYQRLFVENEFQSGYSGARTLLILPVRSDGGSDAHTIVKLGQRQAIQREYASYERFVKDSLPPVTARIQHAPICLRGGEQAAVRYTFIGKPGSPPTSLRQALLENPDPALLRQLFETFAPNWWLQRRPYTFHLGQEYDRLLPAHYALEPAPADGKALDGRQPPDALALHPGDPVRLHGFERFQVRGDGASTSIAGPIPSAGGQPPLRLRASGLGWKNGSTGRITASRLDLLRGWSAGFDRLGLPDPLLSLPVLLHETVAGTRSIIHGDLNLENVLVGPGGMLWLIDFAETREGHPLFDFAHLEAEIIAHVLAPRGLSPQAYLDLWRSGGDPLQQTLHELARACLFNPAVPREYDLALTIACLGALKHPNLSTAARQLLYLTAACLVEPLADSGR